MTDPRVRLPTRLRASAQVMRTLDAVSLRPSGLALIDRVQADHIARELEEAAQALEARPVAWRVRGYAQFKTGKPGPWRYFDGPEGPAVNTPDCCDFEPLYSAPFAQVAREATALVVMPQEVWRFLDGEAPLDGVWFGDRHPRYAGAFWWRPYIRALLQEAPAAPAGEAWMPIETAPRGSGEDGPHNVNDPGYVEPPKLLLWTAEGPVVGYYDWYYHPGYGRGAEPGESTWRNQEGGRTYDATHWMPLPAAPAAQVAQEGGGVEGKSHG